MPEPKKMTRDPDEQLMISPDRLRVVVGEAFKRISVDADWRPPLGVFIGLLVAAVTIDFGGDRHSLGLRSSQWQVIVYGALAASLLWLVRTLARGRDFSADDLVAMIEEVAERRPIELRALMFCRAEHDGRHSRVLVFYDRIWECWFLPHVNVGNLASVDEYNDRFLKQWLADNLGLRPRKCGVQYISGVDLSSVKRSDFHDATTHYEFTFYNVTGPEAADIYALSSTISGRAFAWKTINELEALPNWEKNRDVTRHLADHYDTFFVQARSFAIGA